MPRGQPRKPKRVPAVPPVPAGRQPRALPQPETDERRRLAWRFGIADLDGRWGWRNLDAATMQAIIGKLRHFESMTLNEVFHRGEEPGKRYALARLPAPAATRLQELSLDDEDSICRLRGCGSERIYGFLIDDI